jgi:CDP-glucose 4,6-dehydratase
MKHVLHQKNVLLTGATGLVGGHLAESLIQSGAKVFVLYRNLAKDSYFVRQGLHTKTTNIKGDILDLPGLEQTLAKYKIEYVFHLAAQLKVVTLHETFGFNIMGTNNVLEACRKAKNIKGIILASSNRAYVEAGLSKKDLQKLPENPYDLSKTASDLIIQSYIARYNLPAVICRFGNVYGPGDLHKRIISVILKAITNGNTLEIKKSISPRSYVFAEDVANGFMLAVKFFKKVQGQAISFNSRDSFTPEQLINKISQIVGRKCQYKIIGKMAEDISFKKLTKNDAGKLLGWKPKYSFAQGIKRSFVWYEKNK